MRMRAGLPLVTAAGWLVSGMGLAVCVAVALQAPMSGKASATGMWDGLGVMDAGVAGGAAPLPGPALAFVPERRGAEGELEQGPGGDLAGEEHWTGPGTPDLPLAETRAETQAAVAGDFLGEEVVARAEGGPLDRAQTPQEWVLRPGDGLGVGPQDRAAGLLPACGRLVGMLAERTRVYFAQGSAKIDAGALAMVRSLGSAVRVCPDIRLEVLGFADPSGDAEVNQALSLARAEAARRVLLGSGLEAQRVSAASHLDAHPEDCPHFDGVDRRVEFSVLAD